MNRVWIAAALLVTTGAFATAAHANAIAIYNTGTNAAGTGLATTGQADPHWQLVSTPSSSSGGTAYVVSTYKTTAWTSDPNSQWIAPQADETRTPPTSSQDAPGSYTYQTTFDLTGFVVSTAQLTGKFAVDNCLVEIFLNGVNMGHGQSCSANNYGSFTNFSLTSGFVAGINTLTFVINNAGATNNPSGINVLVSGTAEAPEPGQIALLGLALLGLGGMWIRRRS